MGIDPIAYLSSRDRVERLTLDAVLERAVLLAKQRDEAMADRVANGVGREVARLLKGG